jgi:hypothetical protein
VSVVAVSNGDTSDTTITYAVTVPPTHGTLTTFNSDGTFLYTPNAGNTTTDTFTYSGTSNGAAALQTATLNFSGMVWYVNSSGANGDGRSQNPFNNLASAQAAAMSGNTIFLHSGGSAFSYSGGITLALNQTLWGQGTDFTLGPLTIAHAATKPLVTGTVNLGANGITVSSLDISTAVSTGFNGASISGAMVENSVTVTTTSGKAVSLSNAGGTFTFLSVSANSGTDGISLTNTSGSFTVTGTVGSTTNDGSGGTLQNMTGGDATPVETATVGVGVYLNNAANVSLNHMILHDFQNYAVIGTNVTGFTMTYTTVSGANGTNQGGVGEGDVYFTGLSGSATVDHSIFSGAAYDTFHVFNNSSQTLNRITMTNSSFGSTNTGSNDALVFQATGGTLNVTIQSSSFTAARGDLFQIDLHGTISSDLVLSGSTFTNNNPNIVSGGGGLTLGGGGLGDSVTFTYNISNNSFRDSLGSELGIGAGTGTLHNFTGTIDGNTFGVAGVTNSGSAQGSAIGLIQNSAGTSTITITNNQIFQYNNSGIGLLIGAIGNTNAYLNATVTGNTISNPGTFASNGVLLTAGTASSDVGRACLTLTGNTMTGSGANGGSDIRIRDRFNVKVGLPGYAGPSGSGNTAAAFLSGNNGGASATAPDATLGTSNGTTNGFFGSCPP